MGKRVVRTALLTFAYTSIVFVFCVFLWAMTGVAANVYSRFGYSMTPTTISSLVKRVNPAVVTVLVTNEDTDKMAKQHSPLKQDPSNEKQLIGSGFIVSPDGYIVTNNHVVDGAKALQVTFDTRTRFDAKLIGTDTRSDIALLKIDKPTPQYVSFARETPEVGDWVVAIGSPFGLFDTVTTGIVSARKRFLEDDPYDYIQIDAPVNHGNSGGPAFNLNGEVIGMNTAIFSPTEGSIGIAFAIPAPTVSRIVGELKSHGYVDRAWLGLFFQTLDESTARELNIPNTGAIISEVDPMGPAGRSGLKAKDVVIKVGKTDIPDGRMFGRVVSDTPSGATMPFTVMRNGKEVKLDVHAGKFTPELLKKFKPENKENEDKPHD